MARRKLLNRFIIGLVVVGMVCGLVVVIEVVSKPYDLRVAQASAELFREMPPEIQTLVARAAGKTIEEMGADVYKLWARWISLGLVSVYLLAWGLYWCFARREGE